MCHKLPCIALSRENNKKHGPEPGVSTYNKKHGPGPGVSTYNKKHCLGPGVSTYMKYWSQKHNHQGYAK